MASKPGPMSRTYETQFGTIVEQESSDEDETPDIPIREKLRSSIYLARITSRGKVLWTESIDKVGDAAAAGEAEESKRQKLQVLPCLTYRAMLPACQTQPPIRTLTWIRHCMRSILRIAIHKKKSSTSALHAPPVRFPILAYRFFDGPADSSALVEGLSLEPSDLSRARDENRWGLYYGAKQIATNDAEASLFFRLLDESKGQDFLAFILQVLLEVDKEMGCFQTIDESNGRSVGVHADLLDTGDAKPEEQIWIPVPLALQLTSRRFQSSDAIADLNSLTDRILDLAVDSIEKEGDAGAEKSDVCKSHADEPSTTEAELCIDLFKWIVLVVARGYCEEIRTRHSLARLLFETASTGALTSYIPRQEDVNDMCNASSKGECALVNFPQFEAIVKVLWASIGEGETGELFRISYDIQKGMNSRAGACPPDGVSFQAFLRAADERRFFNRSR